MRIWECGMRIVDFKLSFWFAIYLFQSEIRNPKSEITLAPILQYSKADISGKLLLVIVRACFRKPDYRSSSNHLPRLTGGRQHTGPYLILWIDPLTLGNRNRNWHVGKFISPITHNHIGSTCHGCMHRVVT